MSVSELLIRVRGRTAYSEDRRPHDEEAVQTSNSESQLHRISGGSDSVKEGKLTLFLPKFVVEPMGTY